MIWKNPFLIRQAEKIDTVDSFLQMFSAEALAFLNEQSFNTIQFIRSSPGAGKTTVFKAMQSNVLSALRSEIEYTKDFFDIAAKNKLIEGGEVKLLSCIISCAKNYDLIDEIYRNGRRQQLLFALLNVRIVVLMLKGILTIIHKQDIDSLDTITFNEYPEECMLIFDKPLNGYELYNWAQSEERKICRYLDAFSDEPIKEAFSFLYTTLFFAKLFEPHNILFNKKTFLHHSLIIFDDMQKLTKYQRESVIKTLFTMRPNLGIWIGERLEALSESEIINSDATIGREYGEPINLEKYWQNNGKKNYKKILQNIADRRTKLYSDDIGKFENCLENNIDYEKYEEKLQNIIQSIKHKIETDSSFGKKYLNLFNNIEDTYTDTYEKALKYIVVDISYKRDISKGQLVFWENSFTKEKYKEFYKEQENVAVYYLSIRAKLPYYYGFDIIKNISSYNVEQFLAFSGAVFEQYVAKSIVQSKGKHSLRISPAEQEQCIKQTATQKYNEILRKFQYGKNIQHLFDNLSRKFQQTRDKGTNPYAGEAATGLAITKSSLEELNKSQYKVLGKIISDCISSNYFDKRIITHSGQEWIVLYYNRWLCVYYNLPLSYGGWIRETISNLNLFLQLEESENNQNDLPI